MRQLKINSDGRLCYYLGNREFITPSPVGLLVKDGRVYAPTSAEEACGGVRVEYPCGSVLLDVDEREGYHRIALKEIPEGSTDFIFGPYSTLGSDEGKVLGASWSDDGEVVCIQSLMPKVGGGISEISAENTTGIDISPCTAAAKRGDVVTLQCNACDRSKDRILDGIPTCGLKVKTEVEGLKGPDGLIEGSAVALVAAKNGEELLDIIIGMEKAEGLPYSTVDGIHAKKDPRTNSIYLIFSNGLTAAKRIELAMRAGVSCVYLSDMLGQWGHYTINTSAYPGGSEEIRELVKLAAQSGLTVGTHTLSNFITVGDEYVSPVPDVRLLKMDSTELACDVDKNCNEIALAKEKNYRFNTVLNAVRIDSELITFERFDPERRLLLGCKRGAYGTDPSCHGRGTEVARLWDHGYRTLFPNNELQDELADNLAGVIKELGIGRVSFDGLEGCYYNGQGEYGPAEFVRRVFEKSGGNFICDSSISGNYLWHAMSYANWGEPWYDSARRGGMNGHRLNNQSFFKKNLIPAMMGWYVVRASAGKYRATSPEDMEFMLSRSVAFDAGLAVDIEADTVNRHGRLGEYLDLTALWQDFRLNADIPEDIRRLMQPEESNWHLEKADGGWKLTSIVLRDNDLEYCDRDVSTEAGTIFRKTTEDGDERLRYHATTYMFDRPLDGRPEEIHFRVRVGRAGVGMMKDLTISSSARLHFEFTANGGDYLEYRGGNKLYHYDCDFNLIEEVEGDCSAPTFTIETAAFSEVRFATDRNENADYVMTEIRRRAEYFIPRK